jgi:YidC/Oxa1 family membrane protein insertase
MNKQTITGLVIIGAILFGFSWFQSTQAKKAAEAKRITDSIALANAPAPITPTADFDSLGVAAGTVNHAPDPLGETMAAARNAAPQTFGLSNDVMDIDFSTLGGKIEAVTLKDYKTYGGEPLMMWHPGSERFDVEFFIKHGYNDAQVNTRNFNFTYEVSGGTNWNEDEESKTVTMRLPIDSLSRVEFIYTIPRNDYMLGYRVNFVGMDDMLATQSNFGIDWANTGLQNEKGFDNENRYTTIAYRYPDTKSLEELGQPTGGTTKEEDEPNAVQWVAFKQHYFSSILIAEDNFQGALMNFDTFKAGSGNTKQFHAGLNVPIEREKTSYDFRMYFGPNKLYMLKKYDLSMERLISLGWMSFGSVTRTVIFPLFDWLSRSGMNIGLVILIMTFIIKLVIFPLTFASYKSSAKMRVVKPEIDEISAKYPNKDDAMKKQQATMELYRRAGINPAAGCIPMLIQFPIIIAMFRFFPTAIELRGERLWWAEDLSSFDSVLNLGFNIPFYGDHISLFTILMAISMFGYSWLNFQQQSSSQMQMPGMKFMMLYMMPLMMLVWFNNYAAGLCLYYMISNIFTIGQMYGARLFINEDKLRQKMLSRPAKPKKKSGFMARLEEAQKAQMAQQARQGQGGKRR